MESFVKGGKPYPAEGESCFRIALKLDLDQRSELYESMYMKYLEYINYRVREPGFLGVKGGNGE